MKKNKQYILAVVLLVIIAIFLFVTKQNTSYNKSFSEFRIDDTGAINQIIITENGYEKIFLEKQISGWSLNSNYGANIISVNKLLEVAKNLSVISTVPKNAEKEIIEKLKKANKIQFYQRGKQIKAYYFSDIKTSTGLYMMLDNSTMPFLVGIQGVKNDIETSFQTTIGYWRSKTIFCLSSQEIRSIVVNYPKNTEKSFKISNNNNNFEFNSNKNIKANVERLKFYVSRFNNVNFENIIEQNKNEFADSMKQIQPDYEIIIEDKNHTKKKLLCYTKFDATGKIDPHKLYGILNDSIPVIMKYFDLDPILKDAAFFN